jgi:3-methyladenine DNA glycosylase Mpg
MLKSEKREKKQKKRRQMVVDGKGLITQTLKIIRKKNENNKYNNSKV